MVMQLSFSHKKATQSLNFFARAAGGKINKMKALKLIYFADRCHLRRYGRPITNDMYFAMKFGPVASACRDLLNENEESVDSTESRYAKQFICIDGGYDYSSTAATDTKPLSESDQEALQFAWDNYQNKDQFGLADETHLFPEWQKHQTAIESGETTRRNMPYGDFLLNPSKGVDPLPPLGEEEQKDLHEELEELHAIETIWR